MRDFLRGVFLLSAGALVASVSLADSPPPGSGRSPLFENQDFVVGKSPRQVAAVDVNRDGTLDLVTANRESGSVSILLGRGNGTFGRERSFPAGERPMALAAEDFNLDGDVDLFLTGEFSRELVFLRGRGNGSFTLESRVSLEHSATSVAAQREAAAPTKHLTPRVEFELPIVWVPKRTLVRTWK